MLDHICTKVSSLILIIAQREICILYNGLKIKSEGVLCDDDHLQQLSVTPIHNFSRYLHYGQTDRHARKGTNTPNFVCRGN